MEHYLIKKIENSNKYGIFYRGFLKYKQLTEESFNTITEAVDKLNENADGVACILHIKK